MAPIDFRQNSFFFVRQQSVHHKWMILEDNIKDKDYSTPLSAEQAFVNIEIALGGGEEFARLLVLITPLATNHLCSVCTRLCILSKDTAR